MKVFQSSIWKVTAEISALELNVKKAESLEMERQKLATLKDYLSPEQILAIDQRCDSLIEEVDNLKRKSTEAKKIGQKIENIQQDQNYMPKEEIKKTSEKIEEAKIRLKTISGRNISEEKFNKISQMHEEARKDLECIVCFDVPGKEVFSCQENHIMCRECKERVLDRCPVCRQTFVGTPPTRNRLAEKMILKLQRNI